jgi:hypothetical protein
MNYDLLHEMFVYDDGFLYRKKTTSTNAKDGSVVGRPNELGYLRFSIGKKQYRVHRAIFLMHHGYLPDYIDHIDGNPSNNKIENLRECTLKQNSWNAKKSNANTSGIKGVNWHKKSNKWRVFVSVNGKTKHFGTYHDIDYAKFVAEAMRYKYHGNFANNGKDKT